VIPIEPKPAQNRRGQRSTTRNSKNCPRQKGRRLGPQGENIKSLSSEKKWRGTKAGEQKKGKGIVERNVNGAGSGVMEKILETSGNTENPACHYNDHQKVKEYTMIQTGDGRNQKSAEQQRPSAVAHCGQKQERRQPSHQKGRAVQLHCSASSHRLLWNKTDP